MRFVFTPLMAAALLVFVAGFGTGCQPPSEDLEAIKTQQEQILAKLEAIEKNQKQILARPAGRPGPPPENYDKVHDIPVAHSPFKGKKDAPVALVEFSDFQCPYCQRVNPLIAEVAKKYPDDVKIVFKHFPLSFHKDAKPVAIASMAAQEQGKFWEFHDAAFEATKNRNLKASDIEAYAKTAGVDLERFKKDLEANQDRYAKAVDADMKLGAQVEVRGTPTLYVGGKKVRNRSVAGIGAMIEEAKKRK